MSTHFPHLPDFRSPDSRQKQPSRFSPRSAQKLIVSALLCCALTAFADDFAIRNYPDTPGWIFRPGEEITAVFRSEKPMKSAPVIEWRDYYGNVKKMDFHFTPGRRDVRFRLPTEKNGYFTLKSGKATCRYAVIPAVPKHDSFANPFGINFHLDRITLPEGAREIAFAKYLGYDWGRGMLIDWSELRSADYDRELKRYAGLFRQAKESGMHVLGQILYIPRFASGRPDEEYLVWSRTPTESMKEVTEYAAYMAKHYPWITHWEICNEPDADSFWRGRRSSTGNQDKIFRDYVDFLAAAAKGVRSVDPRNKIIFCGMTSSGPRRFIEVTMANNARKYCDIMNLHYMQDIGRFRSVMKEYKQPDAPFWVTEIGNTAGGPVYDELRQLREDLLQSAEQLSAGAEKIFKYNLRNDGRNRAETEHNYGMLTRDFFPKPNCVANATMIRLLLHAKNGKRINITRCSDAGYLKGFEFDDGKGGKINFVILEGKDRASVTLNTPDAGLLLTDAMGTERNLKAVNGKVTFELTGLPVFLHGRITPNPGKTVYPQKQMVRTIQGKFLNPKFDKDLSQWHLGVDRKVSQVSFQQENGNGFMHIEIGKPGFKNYLGVNTTMLNDVAAIQKSLKEGEILKIRLRAKVRYQNLDNRGIALTADLVRAGENQRFAWRETGFMNGSSDWKMLEVYQTIPKQTGIIRAAVSIAPGTTGTIDVDDVSIVLEVWQNPK